MRTKKAALNVVGSLVLQLVANIAGLVLPRLLITTYGSMINGLISSIRQMLKYLNLLEMGLAGAVIVELYGPLAKKNDFEVSRVLSTSRHFYNQVGLYFSIGAVILGISYPFLVDCKGLPWYYVSSLVLLLGLSGAISFFLVSSYRVLLTADQRSYVPSFVAAGIGVLSFGITVSAIRQGYDIIMLPLISAVSVLMTAYLLYRYAHRIYGSRFRFDMPAEQTAIPQRSAVLINQASNMTELSAPMVITTITLGLTNVSVLAVYNMVFYSLDSMTKTFPRSLQASFGELSAIGHLDRQKQAYSEFECLYTFLVGWIYTTAAILILPFMRVYTQGVIDADYEQPVLGALLVAIGVLRHLKQPSATIVQGAGKYREINRNAIQSVVLGVSLGIAGACLWGLEGLLVGFVISAGYRSGFTIYYCHRHLLMMSLRNFYIRVLCNSMFFAAAWLPFVFWIQINTISLWVWFAWAIGVLAWVGLVFLVGNLVFDLSTVKSTASRLTGLISKRRK